jgi:hypothetical protein
MCLQQTASQAFCGSTFPSTRARSSRFKFYNRLIKLVTQKCVCKYKYILGTDMGGLSFDEITADLGISYK